MHSHEIERRLRLPAPDEPALLPELVLPLPRVGTRTGWSGVRGGPAWQSSAFLSPRIALAVLALLLALVGAIVSGALRLNRLPNPFASSYTFAARGVAIQYPKSWHVVASMNPSNDQGGWTTLIVSNLGVDGCSIDQIGTATLPVAGPSGDAKATPGDQTGAVYATEDRIFECVVGKPMQPGEVRLVLTRGYPQRIAIGPIEPFDATKWFGLDAGSGSLSFYIPTAADGWTTTVDQRPAKLVVETTSIIPKADEVRTLGVYPPGGGPDLWFVRATLRGPDLETLRTEVDAVARSLTFDQHLPPLDEARRDSVLARQIDNLDRETRRDRGSDLYGCFPRSPGARAATINDRLYEYGPDGPLVEPVPVTCTTTIEPTPLGLWHATLVISWDAGDGYAAGSWGWELHFDGDGSPANGGSGQLFGRVGEYPYPGRVAALPAPLTEPLVVPVGSIIEVLSPGIDANSAAAQALAQASDPAIGDASQIDARPGTRLNVVGGPVMHAGFDWYLVEWQHGMSVGSEFAWLPSTDGARPLIKVVSPACPSGDAQVGALVAVKAAERVLCFGDRQLSLDPVIVGLEPGGNGEVGGDPAWLAKDSPWRLYGAGGIDGVDPPLAVAIAPDLGDSLPTGTWLSVQGHFDDAAAATCHRTFPEGWGGVAETADMQHQRCNELFVVTSFEKRGAP